MESIQLKDTIKHSVNALWQGDQDIFVIAGPCSVDLDDMVKTSLGLMSPLDKRSNELLDENRRLGQIALSEHIGVVHRLPVWKPRTALQSWRGQIHTNPRAGMKFLEKAQEGVLPIAVEIGSIRHQEILKNVDAFWVGARSIDNNSLHDMIVGNPAMPAMVKNGLDEDTTGAIALARSLFEQRIEMQLSLHGAAPVLFVHRGGVSSTPKQWEDSLKTANEVALSGRKGKLVPMVVDLSHGAEFAHRPEGVKEKTKEGQLRAMAHIIELLAAGELPNVVGVMAESSDVVSRSHHATDPNVSFEAGAEFIRSIAALNRSNRKPPIPQWHREGNMI